MSKSYKKAPYCGDNKGKKKKRITWKKVRQYLKDNCDFVIKGGNYKKIFESYDICDYYFLYSWEEYWEDCQRLNKLDKEKEYRFWYTHYKRK